MSKSAYAENKLRDSDENDAWTKLFDLFTEGASVLDLGCSSGNFGKALIQKKGCRVVGVDINDDDLQLAAKNLDEVFKRNLEQDDLSDLGTFDYVLMADVIEHVINPVHVLLKVKELLAKNGKLVFSVPNMANMSTRIELLGGRFEYTKYGLLDETHLHYYDRVELESVLTRAGFRVARYNNTIRNIPETILIAQLKKLGLTPNNTFLQLAANIDSVSFQFIGVADPVPGKLARQTIKVESKTPYDFVSRQIDDLRVSLSQQIDHLKDQLDNQRRINAATIEEKRAALEAMQAAKVSLQAIESSKSWRLLSRLHRVKRRLVTTFRQK